MSGGATVSSAFGKKKVANGQQPQLQQSSSISNDNLTTTLSYQQQQAIDASTRQSIAHSDLEGFRLADAEADAHMVFTDESERDIFLSYEPPINAQKEQLLETTEAEGISHLLEHNDALRQNFDNLKQLHLQLAEANAQLQEAFLNMQAEKKKMEGGFMHHNNLQHENEELETQLEEMKIRHAKELGIIKIEHEEISGLAVELEQKNRSLEKKMALMKGDNKELNHKLEVVRYGHDDISESQLSSTQMLRLEKDQALHSKHVVELDYARELSLVKVDDRTYRQQTADLTHKCKHLEIDLEKAILAGETVHQQLVALTYEKDATIMDLEQALRRLRDDLHGLEQQQKDTEKSWQLERHKLQALLDEKEREEYKLKLTIQQEAKQKVKMSYHETVELRTLLNVLEKSNSVDEARHSKALKETKKECDTLREGLTTALATQKAATNRLMDMERLGVQLGDALTQNHELVSQLAQCRKTKDEQDGKIEWMKLELAEVVEAREKEQIEHVAELENLQKKYAEEKSAILKQEDKLMKATKKEFYCKYIALKKRSKHTSKLLATMTVNHNQLIIRLRECEAQLAIAHTTRFHTIIGGASSTTKTSLKLETFNRGLLEAEMKELEDRQAKFIGQSIEHTS